MAVDTSTKRFSLLDSEIPYPPDSAIDQGDRQVFLGGYSGILWGLASTIEYMCLTITGAVPGVSITGAIPAVAMSGTIPGISITKESC